MMMDEWTPSMILDYLCILGVETAPYGTNKRSRRNKKNSIRKKLLEAKNNGISKQEWVKTQIMFYSDGNVFCIDDYTVSCADSGHTHSLAPLQDAPCAKAYPVAKPKKSVLGTINEVKKMDYRLNEYDEPVAVSLAASKVDYLLARLNNTRYEKDVELQRKFGLLDDDRPNTPKELLERIAAGKFVVKEDDMEKKRRWGSDILDLFRWRDPALVEDKKGYDAARDLLFKETTKTEDTIKILDPKDGLAALQALEAWTPTGAAN